MNGVDVLRARSAQMCCQQYGSITRANPSNTLVVLRKRESGYRHLTPRSTTYRDEMDPIRAWEVQVRV
eukprot:scaffold84749_cov43-Tisochrysis_lutea.AAC.1